MIKTGRYGQVLFDPAGTTPVEVISINKWKLSMKTSKQDVTCFGDVNRVYVPGMPDLTGSLSGFWNSEELAILEGAMNADTPGLLSLVPNKNEATFKFEGPSYFDFNIDATVDGAPEVSSEFMAAGPWTVPTGLPLSREGREGRAR